MTGDNGALQVLVNDTNVSKALKVQSSLGSGFVKIPKVCGCGAYILLRDKGSACTR